MTDNAPAVRGPGLKFYIAVALALAVLIGLGSWQLVRLQWKLRLIEQRQHALTADPVSLADIEAGIEHGFDVDVLRTTATGYYRHDLERHVYHLRKGKIGWRVVTPFVVPEGYIVLVDRGFVPDDRKDPASRPDSQRVAPLDPQLQDKPKETWPAPVTLSGFVRVHPASGDIFTPDSDPQANKWYSYDLPAFAETFPPDLGALSPDSHAIIVPVVVQLEPGGEPGNTGLPVIDPLDVQLTNNHLQYALTWYSLALVLLVISVLYIRKARTR